jgi:hypothetical protein
VGRADDEPEGWRPVQRVSGVVGAHGVAGGMAEPSMHGGPRFGVVVACSMWRRVMLGVNSRAQFAVWALPHGAQTR